MNKGSINELIVYRHVHPYRYCNVAVNTPHAFQIKALSKDVKIDPVLGKTGFT